MLSQVSFPLIDPDVGYWYIIWKVNTTPEIRDWIWKTPSAHYASGVGISYKSCLLFKTFFSGDLFFYVLIIGLFYIYVFMGQTHGELS